MSKSTKPTPPEAVVGKSVKPTTGDLIMERLDELGDRMTRMEKKISEAGKERKTIMHQTNDAMSCLSKVQKAIKKLGDSNVSDHPFFRTGETTKMTAVEYNLNGVMQCTNGIMAMVHMKSGELQRRSDSIKDSLNFLRDGVTSLDTNMADLSELVQSIKDDLKADDDQEQEPYEDEEYEDDEDPNGDVNEDEEEPDQEEEDPETPQDPGTPPAQRLRKAPRPRDTRGKGSSSKKNTGKSSKVPNSSKKPSTAPWVDRNRGGNW